MGAAVDAGDRHGVIANPFLRLCLEEDVVARPLNRVDARERVVIRLRVPELARRRLDRPVVARKRAGMSATQNDSV